MAKQQEKDNIPPERILAENIEQMYGEMKDQDRITRFGERYFMSCHCGNFKTTVIEAEVTRFRKEHLENCKGEQEQG